MIQKDFFGSPRRVGEPLRISVDNPNSSNIDRLKVEHDVRARQPDLDDTATRFGVDVIVGFHAPHIL